MDGFGRVKQDAGSREHQKQVSQVMQEPLPGRIRGKSVATYGLMAPGCLVQSAGIKLMAV